MSARSARIFRDPTTTGIPNEIFDEIMPKISPSAFVVLYCIARRTNGFNRESDTISLSQMTSGIKRRDGTQLDGGTGLKPAAVKRALQELLSFDPPLISSTTKSDQGCGYLPTDFSIVVADPNYGSEKKEVPLASIRPPKEQTGEQATTGGVIRDE